MEYASTSPENQDLAKALDDEIGEGSAYVRAAMARVAKACAKFDEIGGWGAAGIRSFPHWLTIKTGFDMHTSAELLRVGQAMNFLPRIAAAFESGQLSFDKVRQITTVATPATEEFLLEIALGASGVFHRRASSKKSIEFHEVPRFRRVRAVVADSRLR